MKKNTELISRPEFLQNPSYRIIEYRNHDLTKSPYSFLYVDFHNPYLKDLRESYKLNDVIKNKKSDLEKAFALSNWIYKTLRIGGPAGRVQKFFFDAHKLLDYRFKSKFECPQFAATMMGCTLATGLTSRLIYLYQFSPTKEELRGHFKTDNPIKKLIRPVKVLGTHVINEVWLNEYGKWAMVDSMNDYYFIDENDIPLSVLEIHQRLMNWNFDNLSLIRGPQRERIPVTTEYGRFQNFRYYSIHYIMANDFYRYKDSKISLGKRWDGARNLAIWIDKPVKPSNSRRALIFRENEINWDLNKVKILFGKIKNMCLPIFLDTVTPDFDYFEVRIDGETQNIFTNNFQWCLKEGTNSLEVSPINKLKQKGVPSKVVLKFLPQKAG